MPAKLIITFHDETWDEIEVGGEYELYWKPTPQGLMIRQEGVRGSRTVYPWQSIRKYHVETEAGLRDQERREGRRAEARRARLYRNRSMGRRRHVQEHADQGERWTDSLPPLGPE